MDSLEREWRVGKLVGLEVGWALRDIDVCDDAFAAVAVHQFPRDKIAH